MREGNLPLLQLHTGEMAGYTANSGKSSSANGRQQGILPK
jgi:hypothetical protein